MKGRLQDAPVGSPGLDVAGDQALAQKVVEQPVEEDLARVFGAAQHRLYVLRLQQNHVRQHRQPEAEDRAVFIVRLV